MGKKYRGYCYLCGEYDTNLTKDHVPPRCFAPQPLEVFTQTATSRFQYARACKDCNKYYGEREKSFKNLMLMGAEGNIQAANDAWFEFLHENRKSLAKYNTPSKDFKNILNRFIDVSIYTPAGIYLGNRRAAKFSSNEWLWLKEEYIKIAKGLHTICTKTIIPQEHEALVLMNEKIIYVSEDFGAPNFYRTDTDFFEYYGYVPSDNLTIGIWYMRFYKGYTAQVAFRPQN